MVSTTAERSSEVADVRIPSVLAVLVVKDGAAWLRDCLQSLSAQTHPRLGVLAVDNRSADGSREMLSQALGLGRIIGLDHNAGLAGSVRIALEVPAAKEADYLLVLHDDTALAPDAVARLVDAAEGIEGVERVGVVGPKVVDWDSPRILREVGRSTDRFGHPYTPLQDGERDHGQYDRVLEVLFVSSCAMLISRVAWQRTGLFDERLASHHDDLDFCWRARLAGFRVLMTPLAQARHRGATLRGERVEGHRHRSSNYYAERAALASMLKNYGVLSLAWLLPLHVILGIGRLALLGASRRFEDAYELLAAWNWNLAHLPGTVRRRIRTQSVRTVPDRLVRRFMESASLRLPRWFEAAGSILAEQRGLEVEEDGPPLRARTTSLARAHPVLVAWVVLAAVAALAYRRLFGPAVLQGGVLPAFSAGPSGFFHELVSGVRTTGLGGAQAGSPALALLGGVSAALFGSGALAQKAFLALLPPIAGVLQYRALFRQTGERVAAVISAACYSLSAVTLWAFSQGRIELLVAVTVLPAVADRLEAAFGPDPPWRGRRLAVGVGVAIAIGVAFYPGVLLALAVMTAVRLFVSRARVRGIALTAMSLAVAAALLFPMVPDLLAGSGAGLASRLGKADFGLLARLAPGAASSGAPGSWPVAWFLPAAAMLAFSVVGAEQRGRAYRAVLAAVAGSFLAWGSAAGYLPAFLSNPPAYLVLAAVCEASLVGYGLATIMGGMERQAFGYRQVAAGALTVVLTAGLALQALDAGRGDWEIGPNRLPPAWPVVASSAPGDFRVLWVGRIDGVPFPPPGGDPQGAVDAGAASLQYAVTNRGGVSALDAGRGAAGDGYRVLQSVLTEVLSGTTRHAGTLLAPLGIRFIVGAEGSLPGAAAARFDQQLDLDLVPAGGLVIYRNARALPAAGLVSDGAYLRASESSNLLDLASLPPAAATPLRATPRGWTGVGQGAGLVLLGDQFAPGWRLTSGGRTTDGRRAFGWATGFPSPRGAFIVTYSRQWVRTVEVIALGLLWLAALWITRRPLSR